MTLPPRRSTQIRKDPGDEGAVRGLVPWRIRDQARRHPRLAPGGPQTRPCPLTAHAAAQRGAGHAEPQPLGLTKPVQGRALRLIQALITATEKELAEAEKNSWIRIPRFDHTPPERLRFVLSGGQPHRASEWADTPGRSLEDQLAEIAQEVTLRGDAAERRRLDEIEAARQKRIRWEAAMEEARVQYAQAYRVRHFEAQEAVWRHATRLTEYVSAVRTRVEAMPPGQARNEAEAWTSWAAATVERLDPLSSPPRLPDAPEPRAHDLRPFLGHWSPYGPTY